MATKTQLRKSFAVASRRYKKKYPNGGTVQEPIASKRIIGYNQQGQPLYSNEVVPTYSTASFTPNELRKGTYATTRDAAVTNLGVSFDEFNQGYRQNPQAYTDSLAGLQPNKYKSELNSLGNPTLSEYISNPNKRQEFANGGTVPKYGNGGSSVVPISAYQLRDNYQTTQGFNPYMGNIQMDPGQMDSNTFGDFGTRQGVTELTGNQGAFDWQGTTDMTGGLQQPIQGQQTVGGGMPYSGNQNVSVAGGVAQGLSSITESMGTDPYEVQYGYQGSATASVAESTPIGAVAGGVAGIIEDVAKSGVDYNEYGVAGNEGQSDWYAGMTGVFDPAAGVEEAIGEGDYGDAALAALLPIGYNLNKENEEQEEAKKRQQAAQKAENLQARNLRELTPNTTVSNPTLIYSNGGTIEDPQVKVNTKQNKNNMMIAAYGGRTHIMPDGTEMPGAYHGDPNAELETKEIFRTPDGSIEKVPEGTPSHTNGGVKMSLPEGTEILGKMKGKHTDGKRYKDLGQGIKKRHDKYEKVVANSTSPLSKRTAQRMMDKVQMEFDALMDDQEMQKGMTTYANGGTVKQFRLGGVTDPTKPVTETYEDALKSKYNWWDTMDQKGQTDFSNLYSYMLNNPEAGFTPETDYQYAKELGATFNKSHDPKLLSKTNKKRYNEYVENTIGGESKLYNTRDVAYQLKHSPKYNEYNKTYRDFLKDSGVPYTELPELQEEFGGQDNAAVQEVPVANGRNLPFNPSNTRSGDFEAPSYRGQVNSTMEDAIKSRGVEEARQGGDQQGWWARNNTNTNLGTAAQFAPAAYNMYQGMFGEEKYLNAGDFQNPYAGKAMASLSDRTYNIKPQLEANELAYQTGRRNVRQMAPGVGGYLSNVSALAGTRMRADAGAYAQKQNVEGQWAGQNASMMAQLGGQEAQTRLEVAQYNAQVDAAKQGALSTGIDQLAGAAYNIGSSQNKQQNDELTRRALEAYLSGQSRFNLG